MTATTAMHDVYFAASVHSSGLAFFASEDERDGYVAANDGAFAVESRQVDPDVRELAAFSLYGS